MIKFSFIRDCRFFKLLPSCAGVSFSYGLCLAVTSLVVVYIHGRCSGGGPRLATATCTRYKQKHITYYSPGLLECKTHPDLYTYGPPVNTHAEATVLFAFYHKLLCRNHASVAEYFWGKLYTNGMHAAGDIGLCCLSA